MVKDWQAFVNPQTIVDREIPCHAPLVKSILTSEISQLLQPASSPSSSSSSSSSQYANGAPSSPVPGGGDGASTESVLDKWTNFLTKLPERFSNQSPRHFNICLGAVASAALRDLTTNGAISFGSWWVVRCWIDEWMSWQAERGGFLNHGLESNLANGNGSKQARCNGADLMDTSEELGHDDSGISLREENIHLLEDVGDDRDNRMVTVNFGK